MEPDHFVLRHSCRAELRAGCMRTPHGRAITMCSRPSGSRPIPRRFAQPGWQYLDTSSGYLSDKGTYVTLKSPNGKDWSTVLETIDAKETQKVAFTITGGLSGSTIHIWETNAGRSFEHVADVTPKDGAFTFTFEPESLYTLTTTTGQGKGSAQPPPPSPFPMPYADDFESTPARARAPNISPTRMGAFEAQPCQGRNGRCLDQVITEKPIPWSPLPDPFTLAGGCDLDRLHGSGRLYHAGLRAKGDINGQNRLRRRISG